ncbi:hypothetical protein BDZ91DRAFT_850024 [Kalaharituber pfeilii]|nr:hypothetical protein BDZ91DRAFT_850024 [Kalaharituber pfeilii]
MTRSRNSLLHILIMDDFNQGSSSSRNTTHRPNTFPSQLSHSARLDRIRRTLRARTNESLGSRRRRPLGTLPDDTGSQSPSATASPGKRRKLEQYPAQIEMAPLELELAYCDGGKYKTTTDTRPESVLYENEDVYCTRSSQCNMIFQHVGAKCFTLKKMVIQGPSIGYTSPVQEGIIFVTMDKNDLLSGCNYPFQFENAEDDDDDDDDDDGLDESDDDDADLNELNFSLEPCEHSPTLRGSPSGFFPMGRPQSAPGEESQIEPSARFKIRRDERGNKMKATLTFEPALSGRYILARFFSPRRRDNIDIQFIGAYGYVGRRCFPAMTPR